MEGKVCQVGKAELAHQGLQVCVAVEVCQAFVARLAPLAREATLDHLVPWDLADPRGFRAPLAQQAFLAHLDPLVQKVRQVALEG